MVLEVIGFVLERRRSGVSLKSRRARLVLLAGSLALACGAGVAMARSGVSRIAATHLYWSTGRIFASSPNGTHVKALTRGRHTADGLAVSGGHLYWVDIGKQGSSGYYSGNGAIVEASLEGTHAKAIAKLHYNSDITHGLPIAVAVVVANGHLYWADNSKIVEANLDGTHAKTIARGQDNPLGMAAGGGHLYWGRTYAASVTSSGSVIWSSDVVEANLDGTQAKSIATVQGFPTSVGVGGGHLYWADGSQIVEANPDGTESKPILGKRSGFTGVFALGPGHLYWAGNSGIAKANLDGTQPKTIVKRGGVVAMAIGP